LFHAVPFGVPFPGRFRGRPAPFSLRRHISGGGGRHLAFPRTDQCAELSARAYEFLGVEVFSDKVRFSAIDQYGKMFENFTVDEKYLSVSAPAPCVRVLRENSVFKNVGRAISRQPPTRRLLLTEGQACW